jgi:hypothetical protein
MKTPLLGQFMLFETDKLKKSKVCIMCKKRLDLKNFYSASNKCKNCWGDHYAKNKKTILKKAALQRSTLEGTLHYIFLSINNKLKSKRTEYKKRKIDISDAHLIKCYSCKVTEEKLHEIWEEQFKKYGMHCPISKQKMTFSRKQNGKQGAGSGYSNTVSIDRLDPNRCYEEGNIIFIANDVNMRKNKVTYEDCKRIIELHEERFKI